MLQGSNHLKSCAFVNFCMMHFSDHECSWQVENWCLSKFSFAKATSESKIEFECPAFGGRGGGSDPKQKHAERGKYREVNCKFHDSSGGIAQGPPGSVRDPSLAGEGRAGGCSDPGPTVNFGSAPWIHPCGSCTSCVINHPPAPPRCTCEPEGGVTPLHWSPGSTRDRYNVSRCVSVVAFRVDNYRLPHGSEVELVQQCIGDIVLLYSRG